MLQFVTNRMSYVSFRFDYKIDWWPWIGWPWTAV